jgi:MFS family permease
LFFYAFFQRVAPSIMIDPLMRDLNIQGAVLGNLSAFYFYSYALMQIPVGLLMNRFGPRKLLTFGAAVCALGTFMFAFSYSLPSAYGGRLLVGIGASFAFVSSLTLASRWLPRHRFALSSGLLMTAGMTGGMLGQAPLATFVEASGWRVALSTSAVVGLVMAVVIWLVVRDWPPRKTSRDQSPQSGAQLLKDLKVVIRTPQNLLTALACASLTAPLLAFAGLWGVAWLMQVHGMSRPQAATMTSMLLLGWAAGSPVSGALGDRFGNHRRALMLAGLMGISSLGSIVYLDNPGNIVMSVLFLVSGVCFGTSVLGFAHVRESNPSELQGPAFGFLNGSITLTGAIFQPLVGALLDLRWQGQMQDGAPIYSSETYRFAFSCLFIFLALGLVAICFIRESPNRALEQGSNHES